MQWTYPFKLEAVGDCSSDASSLLELLISWVDAVTVADEIPSELHPALIVVVDPSGDVVWDFLGFKSDWKLKINNYYLLSLIIWNIIDLFRI